MATVTVSMTAYPDSLAPVTQLLPWHWSSDIDYSYHQRAWLA